MRRREFLAIAAAAIGIGAGEPQCAPPQTLDARRLPRWRGFNLTDKLRAASSAPFLEGDFAFVAEEGFDFVRIPLDYRCWSSADDPFSMREEALKELDEAVAFGRRYGVHVSLCLHSLPGHGVLEEHDESLWDCGRMLDAAAHQWERLSERYRDIGDGLSFNLLNEPPWEVPEDIYARVARRLTGAIRAQDPDRLIIADGLRVASLPTESIVDLGIAQSLHWYEPMHVTHWRAPWVTWLDGFEDWPEPTWPLTAADGRAWTQDVIASELAPWRTLTAQPCGVHVGEFGVYTKTPHAVALAYLTSCLEVFQDAGWGWALWGLRGHFGIMDTGRPDVKYESYRGRQLDREMLELLRRY